MSSYPPAPPDEQQYSALYPSSSVTQQLLDPAQQDQLHFSDLDQSIYSGKTENGNRPYSPSAHVLAQELQHANLDESHTQQMIQEQPSLPLDHLDAQVDSQLLLMQDGTPGQAVKFSRLRKACDSCSIRKVKCDASGPPCRACAALDIPCTFERPSRRRGPPNRHADAIKRRRLDDNATPPHMSGISPSVPSSPTHAAQALAALSTHISPTVSAESLCPLETLELLIDDFFLYLYPSYPFPHEPSFRKAWKRREDRSNGRFLALLASMIGALLASIPRSPRLSLKLRKRETASLEHLDTIRRCQMICVTTRGAGYLQSDGLNIYDAATSFFLARIGAWMSQWRHCQVYLGECVVILKALGLTEQKNNSVESPSDGAGAEAGSNTLDQITTEIGHRIFWATFVATSTYDQFNIGKSELVPLPSTFPPLPMELDDACIHPSSVKSQPEGVLPIISGFNAIANIHKSYDATKIDIPYRESTVDWDLQMTTLHDSLLDCKFRMAGLLSDLAITNKSSTEISIASNIQPKFRKEPAHFTMEVRSGQNIVQDVGERCQIQLMLQRADVYTSLLATRLYLVRKHSILQEARNQLRKDIPDSEATRSTLESTVDTEMLEEQENIVRDLRNVLSSMDEINMAPNADLFVAKIRSIAKVVVDQANEQLFASQSLEAIKAFLEILERLEDDEQLDDSPTLWAELKDAQMKLA